MHKYIIPSKEETMQINNFYMKTKKEKNFFFSEFQHFFPSSWCCSSVLKEKIINRYKEKILNLFFYEFLNVHKFTLQLYQLLVCKTLRKLEGKFMFVGCVREKNLIWKFVRKKFFKTRRKKLFFIVSFASRTQKTAINFLENAINLFLQFFPVQKT